MGDFMNIEIQKFLSLLIFLIDKGERKEINTVVEEIDKKSIINYIIDNYKHKYSYIPKFNEFTAIEIEKLEYFFKDIYASETDANNNGIENNGLLYLILKINDSVVSELFDLKNTYEI